MKSAETKNRKNICNICVILLTLVSFFLSAGCENETPRVQQNDIILSGKAHSDSSKPVVYFGVISRYNPRIMFEEYQPIMQYLTDNTPYKFELKLGKTYEDAVEFLCSGEVQMASLGGVTYLEAHKRCGAVPIVRPLNEHGDAFYRSITVVRTDSPHKTLSDLAGHSFAFASIHSTSGNLIPRYYLAKEGIHLKELKSYKNLKHHDSVAKAVLSGHFDAGAMKDIIAYRYVEKGLRIIHVSDPIPSVPIVVGKQCDEKLITAVKQALLNIDINDPKLKWQLKNWNKEFRFGFVPASDADYEILRKEINEIPRKCGASCHPMVTF